MSQIPPQPTASSLRGAGVSASNVKVAEDRPIPPPMIADRATPLELPAELWLKVIAFARQPAPRPAGRAKRTEIRQHDLTSLMRVNKMFNNFTGPILYSTVIVDHLPFFIRNITASPAARGISPKRDLIKRVKRLFVEYADKSEPTYPTLLRHGGVHFYLFLPSKEDTIRFCMAETDWIAESAAALEPVTGALTSLSTGAYLGGKKDIWLLVWRLGSPNPHNSYQRMSYARRQISALLHPLDNASSSPTCCQRVEFGPLVFQTILWRADGQDFSAHFDSSLGSCPIVPLWDSPHRTRWYFTFNEGRSMNGSAGAILGSVSDLILERDASRHVLPQITYEEAEIDQSIAVSVDMYLLPEYVNEGMREEIERATVNTCAQSDIPLGRCKWDSWRVTALADAPPCPACDWCIEDNDAVRRDLAAGPYKPSPPAWL